MRTVYIMSYSVLDSLKRTKYTKLAGVYADLISAEKAKQTITNQLKDGENVTFSINPSEQLI